MINHTFSFKACWTCRTCPSKTCRPCARASTRHATSPARSPRASSWPSSTRSRTATRTTPSASRARPRALAWGTTAAPPPQKETTQPPHWSLCLPLPRGTSSSGSGERSRPRRSSWARRRGLSSGSRPRRRPSRTWWGTGIWRSNVWRGSCRNHKWVSSGQRNNVLFRTVKSNRISLSNRMFLLESNRIQIEANDFFFFPTRIDFDKKTGTRKILHCDRKGWKIHITELERGLSHIYAFILDNSFENRPFSWWLIFFLDC